MNSTGGTEEPQGGKRTGAGDSRDGGVCAIPVGNAAARSWWPVVIMSMVWVGWIAFLAVMATSSPQAGV